jgi:hypothetical protein
VRPFAQLVFYAELTFFAGHVEKKKAPGILVDVTKFRHKMAPDVQKWRVKNGGLLAIGLN